ncbi:MAG: nucleoside-diphosphate kinase [Candidatus Woesearchaeota archaeon]|jgi:nucleoside-diphosphate kinase|nr:nucleoside-diphosphate kinase [Candidatus Woesearchaeota archaeon]MDP7181247.1 nucleoside-diphosphate kinase [Candidatus Woesearchaeota archaeon]MDP7198134.1 nucleoside-diphosphate kinase [Candidatus Woesearchaeota archaeon]MDP7466968.1 nucleoside-diphosphate kinase [Candidatus Woesearchaeota archaeon]MDP7646946.1 nucleoside-diphosphate kinase [Candidatus Woesearchaeota archaeon]|tara:strand:+ start:50 stop:496 length:447 start_codon:yes stop_codon:yes gene_type:complete
MEQTLCIIKPDGVKRKLVGEVIKRIEKKGFSIQYLKCTRLPKKFMKVFYGHLKKKVGMKLYNIIVNYIAEGPVVVMILERKNAVKTMRALAGPTDPSKAKKGTIRGDLAKSVVLEDCVRRMQPVRNVVHCCGSVPESKEEIKMVKALL